MSDFTEWESNGFEAWRDHQRQEMAALKDSDGGLRGSHKDSVEVLHNQPTENPPSDCFKLTPIDLYCEIKKIIAQECGVAVMWEQHPGPLTKDEFVRIYTKVTRFLIDSWSDFCRAQATQS